MPLIERKNLHTGCETPELSILNPRTWFWGEGTTWKCSKCGKVWEVYEGWDYSKGWWSP